MTEGKSVVLKLQVIIFAITFGAEKQKLDCILPYNFMRICLHVFCFQDKDALEATVRTFEDMEFHILELESGVEDEREGENGESETVMEREITRVQHTRNTSQVS